VHQSIVGHSQGDAEDFKGVVLFQSPNPIKPLAEAHFVMIALSFQVDLGRDLNLFFFGSSGNLVRDFEAEGWV